MHVGDKKIQPVFPANIAVSKDANMLSCDVQTPDYAAAIEIEVNEFQTVVEISLTGAVTLTADIASYLKPGAMVQFKLSADGSNRVATFGTGFLAPALTIVANKSHSVLFWYNGTTLTQVGAAVQLN